MGCSRCGTFPCSYCPYSSLEEAIYAREAREASEAEDPCAGCIYLGQVEEGICSPDHCPAGGPVYPPAPDPEEVPEVPF